MKYLLDTHAILWLFDEFEYLSETAYSVILESTNEKYVSIASAWEMAVKISLGKLTFYGGVVNFFRTVEENGFTLLPIKKEYVELLETLPFHHRDPFDRMLVATAMREKMNLITADSNISLYDVACVW